MAKTKLTPELQDEICKHIRDGNYAEVACALVGVGESTFYDWMRRGRGEGQRRSTQAHVEFVQAVEKADSQLITGPGAANAASIRPNTSITSP